MTILCALLALLVANLVITITSIYDLTTQLFIILRERKKNYIVYVKSKYYSSSSRGFSITTTLGTTLVQLEVLANTIAEWHVSVGHTTLWRIWHCLLPYRAPSFSGYLSLLSRCQVIIWCKVLPPKVSTLSTQKPPLDHLNLRRSHKSVELHDLCPFCTATWSLAVIGQFLHSNDYITTPDQRSHQTQIKWTLDDTCDRHCHITSQLLVASTTWWTAITKMAR